MATQSIDHLIWFRNDLRVHDNQALVAACKNAAVDGGSVAGVFIVAKGAMAATSPLTWQNDAHSRSA